MEQFKKWNINDTPEITIPEMNDNLDLIQEGFDNRYTKTEVDNSLDLKANKQQEEWITPTLLNGVTNYENGFSTVAYMKDSSGYVHIKGTVVVDVVNTTMFILPSGYRPSATTRFPAVNNTTTALVAISPNGIVQWRVASTTLGQFGEIIFRAEQ